VVRDDGSERTLSADLPGSAHRFTAPQAFFQAGTPYKIEVLAIETSGNQTLTEVSFTVE